MNRRSFLTQLATVTTALTSGRLLAAESVTQRDRLAEHTISAIEFKRVRLPWPRLVGKNARLDIHGRGPSPMVCILKTDEGAVGWGMLRGREEPVRERQDRVIGRPVSDLISPARGITSDDLSGLDFALHDLAGVILGEPVWRLLGAERPFITKVYSGMIYFDDLEPAEQPAGIDKVLEECRWDYEYGYRQFKVKIGRGNRWMPAEAGLRRDIEVVKTIAEAFPDCEILVDANDGYTLETSLKFLEGLEGVPLFWFEEPFRETDADWRGLNAWMQANGYSNTYRADGEYDPDSILLETLCADDVVNLRLEDIVGHGFTRWRRWLPELEKQGVAASPHAWGEGLKTVYVAHLAGGLGNIPTIEGVTCGDEDVDFGQNRVVNGTFHPSSAPGFGLTLRGL